MNKSSVPSKPKDPLPKKTDKGYNPPPVRQVEKPKPTPPPPPPPKGK